MYELRSTLGDDVQYAFNTTVGKELTTAEPERGAKPERDAGDREKNNNVMVSVTMMMMHEYHTNDGAGRTQEASTPKT